MLALGPDVVHILTPPDSHATLAMEALRAGAHVFVEKPMAMSEQECIAMAAAAVRAGREICVGHCWLFVPSMLQARELIESGKAGEVLRASGACNFDVRGHAPIGQN